MMNIPGFFGMFNAHRGLLATQNAMNTINHNVTNAGTAGYSKQRVDLTVYDPYTIPGMSGLTGGQLGQGPTVQSITRSRDQFLDAQIRQETGILGQNTQMRDILLQIEGILAEPSTGGINASIQKFFDAAQELSLHPESIAVRADFVQQAVDMVTVFQQQANQLSGLRQAIIGDPAVPGSIATSHLGINVRDVNNKLEAITQLNNQILSIQSSGAAPNDLLDKRDLLLDELSKLVDISVTHLDNGQVNVSIGNNQMVRGTLHLHSLQVIANPGPPGPAAPVGPYPSADDMPSLVQVVNNSTSAVVDTLNNGAGNEITSGIIKGIIDVGGNDPGITTIRGVMEQMDALMGEIVSQVNNLQTTGRDLNGNTPPPVLFDTTAGAGLAIFRHFVNPTVLNDPSQIAAAIDDPAALSGAPPGFAGPGDGRNALALAQLRDGAFAGLGNTGFIEYFNALTSNLGIDTRSYKDLSASQNGLTQSLELRRQSVSGVNVDEEMIDLLRYQRAFEATSRTLRVFDEVIQDIINLV